MITSYVSAKQASIFYHTSISNLRKWARENKIPTIQTKGGHYKYIIQIEDDNETQINQQISSHIIYARVSSKKQKPHLSNQVEILQQKFPTYTLITDIGSGINFKRKGFRTILELLFAGKVKKVVVAYQDRFSRFGFEFFEWLFQKFNAKLEVLDKKEQEYTDDLTNDLMEIITVFTARYYGKRNYNNHTQNTNLS